MTRLAAVLTVVLLPIGAATWQSVWASGVTVADNELQRLRAIIRNYPDAAAQFNVIRGAADHALLESPRAIAHVTTEGKLASDPQKRKTGRAIQDMKKIEALAWTWSITGDARYRDKAREFILAWAAINKPDGNPINETNFEGLIKGYDLVRSSFSQADRKSVDAWLRAKATTLWKSNRMRRVNWQSQRLKIVGMVALTLNDTALWQQVSPGFKQQIATNFHRDGESVDFEQRDALHYHLYAVEPMVELACAARDESPGLFDYRASNGASLRGAVDFVKPFAEGGKQHVEFKNSQVDFDAQRARDGEAEYQPHTWRPETSVPLFSEAACLDGQYEAVAAKVAGTPGKKYINWQTVLNASHRGSGQRN